MSAVLYYDEQRTDPGELASLVLAVLVHVLLALILVFGVQWQNRPPEVFQAELWEAPRPVPPPAPLVVEPPKPAPRVEPAPPPPEPKPAPRIEKPDIVVKAPPPPKPKPEVKPPPKPEPPKAVVKPKPEPVKVKPVAPPSPPKPPSDAAAQQRVRDELAREQMALASGRERDQIADMLKRDAAAASAAASTKSLAGWIDKIRSKIKGNILLPPDIKGNPEAIFDVVQLPTGEVLSTKLRKSSGNAAYDAAVERAILKSSPLPRPDRQDQFRRELELKFRPHDPI
jgi:colicin import membrane protein